MAFHDGGQALVDLVGSGGRQSDGQVGKGTAHWEDRRGGHAVPQRRGVVLPAPGVDGEDGRPAAAGLLLSPVGGVPVANGGNPTDLGLACGFSRSVVLADHLRYGLERELRGGMSFEWGRLLGGVEGAFDQLRYLGSAARKYRWEVSMEFSYSVSPHHMRTL
ncbi:hypothetical protein [Streptosporangium sp. NPDC003464]